MLDGSRLESTISLRLLKDHFWLGFEAFLVFLRLFLEAGRHLVFFLGGKRHWPVSFVALHRTKGMCGRELRRCSFNLRARRVDGSYAAPFIWWWSSRIHGRCCASYLGSGECEINSPEKRRYKYQGRKIQPGHMRTFSTIVLVRTPVYHTQSYQKFVGFLRASSADDL